MILSARQQQAAALARELSGMDDVWVTSPLPLDDQRRLRIQIADRVKNEVIQILKDWGHEARFVSVLPRVCSTGLQAACLWEVDFPGDRQPIIDDRTIRGEIATSEKSSYERESILRYLGIKK